MTTVERAEMLLQQDAAIYAKINDGATLDEPSIRAIRNSARWRIRNRCRCAWPSVP